ncbi:MAG: hypothetical protein JJU40_12690 [Rhodobacteraceae bacterium]|nr:hypothetical protein [Paracoccaceae bacterium]
MTESEAFRAGARNLLVGCARLAPGQRLLIATEDTDPAFYEPELGPAIAAEAEALGLSVTMIELPFSPITAEVPSNLAAQMAAAEATLFLARLGDQMRFSQALAAHNPVVCYALDREMLASDFGRADHAGLVALKSCIDTAFARARNIRVTCPLGTDFAGPGARFPDTMGDVSIRRFPMSVFTPVPAGGFAGHVVQEGFLVGTGASYYVPYAIALDGPIRLHFRDTQLLHIEGAPGDVAAAQAHYRHVAQVTGAARDHFHSWHAGMHPGCDWKVPAATGFERWSGGAFGNPRVLHFHTCGTVAPGEISLNMLDATVTLDDVAVWDAGVLHPERIAGGPDILERFPDLAALFKAPAQGVGAGSNGRLVGRIEEQTP